MLTNDDLIAIHRAFATGGRDLAMLELRRRFTALNDKAAPFMLDKVLDLQVPLPGEPTPGKLMGPRFEARRL